MRLYYLHGFASSIKLNSKVEYLREYHDDMTDEPLEIHYVDYFPHKVQNTIEVLDEIFSKTDEDSIVMGTSLGGFWAAYVSIKYKIPCILINPSTEPHITLPIGKFKYVDSDIVDLVAKENRPEFKDIADYIKTEHHQAHITAILALDDDVLDYKIAYDLFKNHQILFSPFGGHMMKTKAWAMVFVPILYKHLYNLCDS